MGMSMDPMLDPSDEALSQAAWCLTSSLIYIHNNASKRMRLARAQTYLERILRHVLEHVRGK
jgi:hypothetical protein